MDATQAARLMEEFAERTGLVSDRPPKRYLWTDAFAVCTFLGLADATGEERYVQLARKMVDQVHFTLGRHRDDDDRTGWISGLNDEQGRAHPTRGGLRIGKPNPERAAGEAINRSLEWERDGQYFHYLTKWMHALDQVARATDEPRYNLWARELADVAVEAFSHRPSNGGLARMHWKMSIDLSRPQVHSMGQHDPLDGYITCKQLITSASMLVESPEGPHLDEEIDLLYSMVEGRDWVTTDPLGLGGLLMDAKRLDWIIETDHAPKADLLTNILNAARRGLEQLKATRPHEAPAERRLAFRELGLAIGLYCAEHLSGSGADHRLEPLAPFFGLRQTLNEFWQAPQHREARSWQDHRDINDVMLATSLLPDGFILN